MAASSRCSSRSTRPIDGEGWRVALKDELRDLPDDVAERILSHFPADRPHPSGRSQIGFLEVTGEREVWTSVQTSIGPVKVVRGTGPSLAPMIRLLNDGGPFGVVVVSLERVRAFEWILGRIEELERWELEVTSLDWRERKSPQRNPQAGGTGTTAAGRDQTRTPMLDAGSEEVEHLNREREEQLVEHIEEAIGAEPGVALGQTDVLAALEMAQARHVIFDPAHEFEAIDGLAPTEEFVARALATGADVTPASGFAAEALSRRGGVAALLRFATETQP